MLRKHRPHSIQTLSSLMGRTRFAQEVASTLECFQGVSFSQNQEYPDWQPLSDDSMKHLPALDGFDGPSREKWFHKQPLSLSQSEVTKTYDCTEGCLGSKLGCTGPCHFFLFVYEQNAELLESWERNHSKTSFLYHLTPCVLRISSTTLGDLAGSMLVVWGCLRRPQTSWPIAASISGKPVTRSYCIAPYKAGAGKMQKDDNDHTDVWWQGKAEYVN